MLTFSSLSSGVCFLLACFAPSLGLPDSSSCRCNVAITISTATSTSIAARSIATATTISIAQAQQAARARQTTHCIHCPACACRTTHTCKHAQHVECDRHAYQILQLLAALQSALAWPETAPARCVPPLDYYSVAVTCVDLQGFQILLQP